MLGHEQKSGQIGSGSFLRRWNRNFGSHWPLLGGLHEAPVRPAVEPGVDRMMPREAAEQPLPFAEALQELPLWWNQDWWVGNPHDGTRSGRRTAAPRVCSGTC